MTPMTPMSTTMDQSTLWLMSQVTQDQAASLKQANDAAEIKADATASFQASQPEPTDTVHMSDEAQESTGAAMCHAMNAPGLGLQSNAIAGGVPENSPSVSAVPADCGS